MSGIEINVSGLDGVVLNLAEIQARTNKWGSSRAAIAIALAVQADIDQRFVTAPGVRSSGTVYGGVTWERLTEAYLKRNPRREGGQQLRDTGELLQSFQVNANGNVFEQQPNSVTVGSKLPKARGLNNKRQLIVVHDPLLQAVKSILEVYLRTGKV